MKERPILFSAPMVQAILDNRKGQTRRVVRADFVQRRGTLDAKGWRPGNLEDPEYRLTAARFWCPYGQPGDRLWVRETWFNDAAFGAPILVYRADGSFDEQFERHRLGHVGPFKWRPSIHMPRWASRLTLEVTEVRVERLQDITEEDARAEGAPLMLQSGQATWLGDPDDFPLGYSYRNGFAWLWKSINGAGSWDANPWLWVVEFRRAA